MHRYGKSKWRRRKVRTKGQLGELGKLGKNKVTKGYYCMGIRQGKDQGI